MKKSHAAALLMVAIAASFLLMNSSISTGRELPAEAELKIGEKLEAGGYSLTLEDLSPSRAMLKVAFPDGRSYPAVFIKAGEEQVLGGELRISARKVNVGEKPSATILVEKAVQGVGTEELRLTENDARKRFAEDYPQYPEENIVAAIANCPASSNKCWAVSSHRQIVLAMQDGGRRTYLDGVVAYFSAESGELVGAYKTN